MSEILLLLTGAILVNHVVLTRFISVGPLGGVYGQLETAAAIALATLLAMMVSASGILVLQHFLLRPYGLMFLRGLVDAVVIIAAVGTILLLLPKLHPLWSGNARVAGPILLINCVILGMALYDGDNTTTFVDALLQPFIATSGVAAAMVLHAALRERLNMGEVPEPFRGSAITVVTVGLVCLALMGFAGLV